MNRREVLGLLCLGGASAGSGCSSLLDSVRSEENDRSTTQTDTVTPTATTKSSERIKERMRRLRESEPPPEPTFNFDYGVEAANDIADPAFTALRATSRPKLNGDRLRITPGTIAAEELAARLRIVWRITKSAHVTRTITGTDVTFAGGVAGRYAYLVGVLPSTVTAGTHGQVLATRSVSLANARKLTTEFKEEE